VLLFEGQHRTPMGSKMSEFTFEADQGISGAMLNVAKRAWRIFRGRLPSSGPNPRRLNRQPG